MGWLFWIIVISVCVGTCICFVLDFDPCTIGEWMVGVFAGTLIGMLCAIIPGVILVITATPSSTPKYDVIESHTVPLVQSQVHSKIEGYRGIFYGRIDEKDVFRFYVQKGDGYTLDYFETNNGSRIIESDETPRALYFDKIKYTNKPTWYQRAVWGKTWDKMMTTEKTHCGFLYVPKGTIIQNKFDGLNL